MDRRQVLAQMVPYYNVSGRTGGDTSCASNAESCMLWTKSSPVQAVASLAFKDGKVSTVVKYWDPKDQQQAAPFARSVYGAIAALVKDGKTTCIINASENDSPNAEQKTATITCGGRKIDIDVVHTEKGESALISEWLK
jgi:hypothetical protein